MRSLILLPLLASPVAAVGAALPQGGEQSGVAETATLSRVQSIFARADADGDGRLDTAECEQVGVPTRHLELNDADGDRSLGSEEFTVYYRHLSVAAGREVASDLGSEVTRIQALRHAREEGLAGGAPTSPTATTLPGGESADAGSDPFPGLAPEDAPEPSETLEDLRTAREELRRAWESPDAVSTTVPETPAQASVESLTAEAMPLGVSTGEETAQGTLERLIREGHLDSVEASEFRRLLSGPELVGESGPPADPMALRTAVQRSLTRLEVLVAAEALEPDAADRLGAALSSRLEESAPSGQPGAGLGLGMPPAPSTGELAAPVPAGEDANAPASVLSVPLEPGLEGTTVPVPLGSSPGLEPLEPPASPEPSPAVEGPTPEVPVGTPEVPVETPEVPPVPAETPWEAPGQVPDQSERPVVEPTGSDSLELPAPVEVPAPVELPELPPAPEDAEEAPGPPVEPVDPVDSDPAPAPDGL